MSSVISFNVSGMKCGGCEASLSGAIAQQDGVLSVKASHLEKRVDIEFDDQTISAEDLEDVITAAGYHLED